MNKVRFAPSPTGPFHIGNARTALFNHLFAKKYGAGFVLRIEDTDKERSKKEYEEGILSCLKWLDIEWNEGPYRQSERKEIYEKYVDKLIEEKKVYYCFCAKQELEAQRQYAMSIGKPPLYAGKCHQLKKEELEKNLKEKKPYVLRLKTPSKKIAFQDIIRGKIEYDSDTLGDFVIAKGKQPLYNLACAIDDFEMKITHVIRGEDHIPNTPKQILINKALGFKNPKFLHLPLVLGPDKSKLSKRHGATFMKQYEEEGFLPEALINFMAFLGWNPKTEKEVFSLKELEKEFTFEKIQKSGAVFNINKLLWLNGFYIRKMPLDKLAELCCPYLIKAGLIFPLWDQKQLIVGALKQPFAVTEYQDKKGEKLPFSYIKEAVGFYQERLKKLSEISELIDYFFEEPEIDKNLLKWKNMKEKDVASSLDKSKKILSKIKKWNEEEITKALMKEADKIGDRGKLLWPLRVALSGKKSSAGPFEIAYLLGKEKTLRRIKKAKP